MVLAEVPLWVSHGNHAAAAAAASARCVGGPRLPGSMASAGAGLAAAVGNNAASNANDDDRSAGRAALSLLASTLGGGVGSSSTPSSSSSSPSSSLCAPMYSVDVHPDGTRFATAAGDGTVKVWSTGALFAGRLLPIPRTATTERRKSGKEDEKKGGNNEGGERNRGRGASSRFAEGGNYVSSNSEDYCDTTSGSSDDNGNGDASSGMRRPAKPWEATAGVNDLTGLVRKKKQGGKAVGGNNVAVAAASQSTATANPFAPDVKDAASDGNIGGPLSPLSRLTRRSDDDDAVDAAAAASSSAADHDAAAVPANTISSHEGSVLCVRFSSSGTYLATAGDDSYVNVHARSAAPSLARTGNLVGVGPDGRTSGGGGGCREGDGSAAPEDVEHWNRVAVCRGHHLDVVGLAWAPDDSHLASCSLDSNHPVIVWKLYDVLGTAGGGGEAGTESPTATWGQGNGANATVIRNLHPHRVLGANVHTSTVKGVAFDPAGKFLATSGDDPAVCIWRASDDWGLEARVDAANSGVFRSRKRRRAVGENAADSGDGGEDREEEEDDPGELASLSLFRRISFAPDGSHVCSTNATLRGKNIAAMISREGWAASGPGGGGGGDVASSRRTSPPGAANLVGHKQPVVASRHCSVFFEVPRKKKKSSSSSSSEGDSEDASVEDEEDPDAEPEYATLVALGDKRGFLTVWSTKSARPIFKMQCSEHRCQVTDIAWGVVRRDRSSENDVDDDDGGKGGCGDSVVMIVSLLAGHVVALHFDVPAEVGGGGILSGEKTRRVFKLKYGIDDFVGNYGFSPGGGKHGRRPMRRLVDDARPMLIENALQLTMELEAECVHQENESGVDESEDDDSDKEDGAEVSQTKQSSLTSGDIETRQMETSTTSGKKRIRPVLVNANHDDSGGAATSNVSYEDGQAVEKDAAPGGGKKRRKERKGKEEQQSSDLLQNALNDATRAASVAEGVATQATDRAAGGSVSQGAASRGTNDARSSALAVPVSRQRGIKCLDTIGPMTMIMSTLLLPTTMPPPTVIKKNSNVNTNSSNINNNRSIKKKNCPKTILSSTLTAPHDNKTNMMEHAAITAAQLNLTSLEYCLAGGGVIAKLIRILEILGWLLRTFL